MAIQERLEQIDRGLPVSPLQDARLEVLVAPELATELSRWIECIAEDLLRPGNRSAVTIFLAEALRRPCAVTVDDLKIRVRFFLQSFSRWPGRWRRCGGGRFVPGGETESAQAP
jgi:hypothetical protein